jgi:hypothetical protein
MPSALENPKMKTREKSPLQSRGWLDELGIQANSQICHKGEGSKVGRKRRKGLLQAYARNHAR